MADAIEAVIAAIYLDSDITQCKDRIVAWLSSRIDKVTEGPSKDPKSLLQEHLQKEGLAIPLYTIIKIEGDPHQQVFYVECTVEDMDHVTKGMGSSKRRAEQEAAASYLKHLQSIEV